MILHLIFYFVVFCVIFAYNILDNGYIPFIIDIIFVSISIISVVVCMILRAGIKCSFETEMLTVRRNEKNDISIRLRNKSFIPAPYCKFRIKFIMGNGKRRQEDVMYSALQKEFRRQLLSFRILTVKWSGQW